jgi:hypothetical protein
MVCCAPRWRASRRAMIPVASIGAMQLRLDLGGSAVSAAALWELVGPEERRAAVALLTALIARAVAGEEALDELASLRDSGASGGRGD